MLKQVAGFETVNSNSANERLDKSWTPAFVPVFPNIPLTSSRKVTLVTVTVTRIMNDALTNGLNGVDAHPNGVSTDQQGAAVNGNGVQFDSPTTPISNSLTASDLKIDMDMQEPESDVRHEPLPIKIDTLENASIAPQVGTPLDPGTLLSSSSFFVSILTI